MDVDLRKLRYFVAVADHRHFGRAAAALHIAQPVLSRQIKALETELKAQLFLRDRRSTELTAAGVQLLADARPLLANAAALRRRVGIAARGSVFTVGFMPGLLVTDTVRAMSTQHPTVRVDVLRTSWADQTDVLHDGRADVSYVRLPVDPRGLRVLPLGGEPRVAVLRTDHRLAHRPEVELADLVGERLLQNPAAVPEWPDRQPSEGEFRLPRTVEEKLEHIATGDGVAVLPLSTARFYTRPDLTYVPVTDLAPSEVGLAWDATRDSSLISDFARVAEANAATLTASAARS